jgi:hypothetical protein
VLLHLVPIWAFPYLPTQDGPAHLSNALILKDYGAAHTRYHEFFELHLEAYPNWTTQLLLVGLLYLLPPLVAEKVLASLHVAGFALSLRYFLGSFGRQSQQLAAAGLLFLFNRCFLFGFYNYCLSLILVWLSLGYCLRRQQRFGAGEAVGLLALLWLAYFTHLLGYLLAAAGAAWVVGTAPRRRVQNLLWVGASVVPTGWLAISCLLRTGFLGLREAAAAGTGWLSIGGQADLGHLWPAWTSINQQLFAPYEGPVPMGPLVLLLYEALLVATLFAWQPSAGQAPPPPRRWPVAILGLALGGLALLLPDFLSKAVGFLKARLLLLPPLLWLACLRIPPVTLAQRLFGLTLYLLLGANLVLVLLFFQQANRELAEYTAGTEHVGHGRTLFVVQPGRGGRLVSPLEHAADYYCLTTGNVNLDNYQAALKHFPVRFRSGVANGRGSLAGYPHPEVVDVILVWDSPPGLAPEQEKDYREVYRDGRLRIFARKERPTGESR